MDTINRYHTRESYLWVRAEHLALIGVIVMLLLFHLHEVNWMRFILAIVLIDLVGYVPGAIAYRLHHGGPIPAIYHHLYNLTHSYITGGLAVGFWALLGGFEWAMLAVPLHYSGDRGIFGNTYKPLELPFEPASAGNVAARPVAAARESA
jgi:hypothetical protein